MLTVETLIDMASKKCGSDAALARRIGKARSQITAMRTGAEPPSPEAVALMCDVLELSGEEARRLAALAIVQNPKNARKAEVLRRAFFVCVALGVAVTLLTYAEEGTAKTASKDRDYLTQALSC